jgi:hypothetical protein
LQALCETDKKVSQFDLNKKINILDLEDNIQSSVKFFGSIINKKNNLDFTAGVLHLLTANLRQDAEL